MEAESEHVIDCLGNEDNEPPAQVPKEINNLKYPSTLAHTELKGICMPKKQRGRSHSTRPVSKRPPSWCSYQPEEVEALVIKLAKEGHSSSKIGTILRDQHAIPLVKAISGKTITQMLKQSELAPSIPEDLGNLLKKASKIVVHIEKNNKDLHNKRALQVVEAKIHKLSRYYRRKGILPPDWKYRTKTATIV